MAIRKFLTSVADVYAYDQDDNLLFTGKTLLDSSVEVSLGSAPVRGGRGNQLQYVYYHTGEMNVTLTDTQWNLGMLGATVGSEISNTNNIYYTEDLTLNGSLVASATKTPISFEGTTIYGWATDVDGNTERVTFSGNTMSLVANAYGWVENDVLCVRYYTADVASQGIQISSNIIPKVVRLVMEAQLNSADVSTNKIGIVQIIVPRLVLSGAFSISMTADGVANTPLTGMALAYKATDEDGGCLSESYYAKIVEILTGANWYDNLTALAIEGGDFSLAESETVTLKVWAIPSSGLPFIVPDYTDLLFTSATVGVATVGATTGIVEAVAATGTSLITVKGAATLPAAIQAIEASATVTATA